MRRSHCLPVGRQPSPAYIANLLIAANVRGESKSERQVEGP